MKKIKVLFIDINSIHKSYQQTKCSEMARYDDTELLVLVPESWKHINTMVYNNDTDYGRFKVITGKTIFRDYSHRFIYRTRLFGALKDFKPDIIHTEQEPFSLLSLQILFFKSILCPKAKLIVRASSAGEKFGYKFPFLYNLINSIILKNVDSVHVINKDAKDWLTKKNFPKDITIVPHGTDISRCKKLDVTNMKKDLKLSNFTIGYVGRLVVWKGVEVLLKAVSQLKDEYKVLIVGDGPLRFDLESTAKRLNILDKVVFINTVPLEVIVLYLNCMDVLVLPSITMENVREKFGLVLIEAMACEVPVIGSDCGGIPDVIGDAGLIFKEKDVDDLRSKIELVMKDEELRTKMSAAGHRRILDNFTWQRVARDYHDMYLALMAKEKKDTA